MRRCIKVAGEIKVANQLALQIGRGSWVIHVGGPKVGRGSLQVDEGGRREVLSCEKALKWMGP